MIICECIQVFVELNILTVLAVYDIIKVPLSIIERFYNNFTSFLTHIYSEGKFYVRIIASENFYVNLTKKCYNSDNITSLIICSFCLLICYLCSAYLTERENKKYNSLVKEMKNVKESLPNGVDERIVEKCVSHLRNANNFTNFLVYSAQRKHILRQCKKGSKVDWVQHQPGILFPYLKPKRLYRTSVSSFQLLNYNDFPKKLSHFSLNSVDSSIASCSSWHNSLTTVSSDNNPGNKTLVSSQPSFSNTSIQDIKNSTVHSFHDISFNSGKPKPMKTIFPGRHFSFNEPA